MAVRFCQLVIDASDLAAVGAAPAGQRPRAPLAD
jgi:hypothetical protein